MKEGKQEWWQATGRHDFIKVRYGTPGHYCYSKGDDLDIKETATSVSMITITLRKVVDGNYGTRQITGEEFGDSEPAQKEPTPYRCSAAARLSSALWSTCSAS